MRIYLRPITKADGNLIVKWRNDEVVKNHCFDKSEVTIESNEKFFDDYIVTGKYKQYIVERVEESCGVASYSIATVYLKDIDRSNKRCELCVFTSNDEEWNSESQSIAVRQLVDKAFTEFDIHKIYSYVISTNQDEVELLNRAGFKEEATLEKEYLTTDGTFVNIIRMAIFKKVEVKND